MFAVLTSVTMCGVMVLGMGLAMRQEAARTPVRLEVFGPGVLSQGQVFRGSFSPDGTTFYFFKKTEPETEEYRIFVSRLTAGAWSQPQQLDLGGDFSNTYPAISSDGQRLVFASSRPAPGLEDRPNFYLWRVERRGAAWSEPTFLDTLNLAGHYHSWVAFGPDGKLHFRRTTPDWRASTSFTAPMDNGQPGTPVIDAVIERCRALKPDLRIVGGLPGPRGEVYFLDVAIPARNGAPAHSDIWISHRSGGEWSVPRPLGPEINTGEFETFPFFSPDARQFYFVRAFRTFYRLPLADVIRAPQSR